MALPADSGWRRASLIWSGLALVASAAPAAYLVLSPVYRDGRSLAAANPHLYVILGALVAAPGLSLLLRRNWRACRAATLASALLLTAVVVLGGFSIGLFFVPAALCALLAMTTELMARPGG